MPSKKTFDSFAHKGVNDYLGQSMGCHKIPYQGTQDTNPFLGVWKEGGYEKSSFLSGVCLAKKEASLKNRDSYYPFGMSINALSSSAPLSKPNRFKFNGIELEDAFEVNMYTAFYRSYDPTIGRWMQIDPKASERESPYVGMGNNPINYYDYLGDTIRDDDNIVGDYRASLNTQIAGIDEILDQDDFDFAGIGTTRDAVVQLQSELNGILSELDALESSEQVYKVAFNDDMGNDEGGVSFDGSDNSVVVNLGRGAGIGVVSQELLHAYQFESGEISIAYDNSFYGTLYDLGDETATYQREHLVVRGVAGLQTRNNVTNASVLQLGQQMTPPAYQSLPRNNINMNSQEAVNMRMTNVVWLNEVGRPREVYKGWNRIPQQ